MSGKYGNWLRKHEVEDCQRYGDIRKRRKKEGTARYGKWQDEMTSDINYEIERGL